MRSNNRHILFWIENSEITMKPFNSHDELNDFVAYKENGVSGKFYIVIEPEQIIEVA
jgi:hypothetical protein